MAALNVYGNVIFSGVSVNKSGCKNVDVGKGLKHSVRDKRGVEIALTARHIIFGHEGKNNNNLNVQYISVPEFAVGVCYCSIG